MNKIVLITGISGSGRTTAMSVFEELDYYCMENLPALALEKFLLSDEINFPLYQKMAISIYAYDAPKIINLIKKQPNISLTVIFLDTTLETLETRFRLSRHIHPLSIKLGLSLELAIKMEKDVKTKITDDIDYYIDTTGTDEQIFRYQLTKLFSDLDNNRMTVHFSSFGFKHGVPRDADLVLDVRILANPYYIPELKVLTGKDQRIINYVLDSSSAHDYLSNVISYLDFYLMESERKFRKLISVAIGCSGGQHRSVVMADYLSKYYQEKYHTLVTHRDSEKK